MNHSMNIENNEFDSEIIIEEYEMRENETIPKPWTSQCAFAPEFGRADSPVAIKQKLKPSNAKSEVIQSKSKSYTTKHRKVEEHKDDIEELRKELNLDLFKTPPWVKDSDEEDSKPGWLRDEWWWW